MADTTSRVFSLLGIMLCVWVAVYWLYEPSARRSIVLDDRPSQAVPPLAPAPELPEPRSLPRVVAPPVAPQPEPRPEPPPPPLVAGPGEVLIPPQFENYTVQAGDTFQSIARRFYGDTGRWRAVSRANPLLTPEKLKPGVTIVRIARDPDNIQGKVVKIDPPARPAVAPAPETQPSRVTPAPPTIAEGVGVAGWRTYTVQESDTLWGIAKKMYGRPSLTDLIAQANTDVLPDPDRLSPGIVLKIPPAPAAD